MVAHFEMHAHTEMPAHPRMLVRLQGLAEQGYEIISTGGTHTAIQKMGVAVKKVEDVTGFPEMLDGGCDDSVTMGVAACVIGSAALKGPAGSSGAWCRTGGVLRHGLTGM